MLGMNRFFALFALLFGALALPGIGAAQDYPTTRTISTERWVEEWDPASQRWVRIDAAPGDALAKAQGKAQAASVTTTHMVNGVVISETQTTIPVEGHERFALPLAKPQFGQSLAQYGPFRVLDHKRAAIVDSTDQTSPSWFDAMLRDYPGLEVLEMIEAPGTRHDLANLEVGRRIRAAGLRTYVPNGGSVRSGAVELFLAGTERVMEDSAQFAVHSWLDNYGREPRDFPEDHPANRLYLDYYVEMGMSEAQARGFYSMTNSVPHADALWLGADEMRPWVREPRPIAARQIAAVAAPPLPVLVSDEGSLILPMIEPEMVMTLVLLAAPVAAPSIAYDDVTGISVGRAGMSLLDS